MKRKIALPFCGIVLLLSSLPILAQSSKDRPIQTQLPQSTAPKRSAELTSSTTRPLPDELLYETFFKRLKYFHKRAEQEEKQGRNGNRFRSFLPSKLDVAPYEIPVLEDVAFSCLQEVGELDRDALQVIDQARADCLEKGISRSSPPSLPARLVSLQKQRDAVFIQGRERLSRALGESRLMEFEMRLRQHIEQTSRPLNRQR